MPDAIETKHRPARRGPAVFGIPFNLFRALVFTVGLLPFLRWFWLGYSDGLTANPIEFLQRSAGTWTLVFLLATLAVTPLRVMTGQAGLVKLRRMLGLFAFFYAFLHFTSYVWWDQWFDPAAIVDDVIKRPFITVGFAAFLLLIPLAVTSTKGWVRRLGGQRWQLLHRLIYLIGPLALLHLWWHKAGKNDFFAAGIYAAVLVALLGWRLARYLMAKRSVS